MLTWFESVEGDPTQPECTITISGLFTDETCSTTYSDTDVTLSQDSSGDHQMSFSTVAPTNQSEIFLCVQNGVSQI